LGRLSRAFFLPKHITELGNTTTQNSIETRPFEDTTDHGLIFTQLLAVGASVPLVTFVSRHMLHLSLGAYLTSVTQHCPIFRRDSLVQGVTAIMLLRDFIG
jgi:hypothetical protein